MRRRNAWLLALAVIVVLEALAFRGAVGADWYRAGNDMVMILAEARGATHREVLRWITGPWIGKEIFVYYRPLTSLLMYGEYRAFGEHSAPWQAISLLLHIGSTLCLALLCARIFRSRVAGLVAACVWGFRAQMGDAIAWTPAQTDLLAACFALLALLTLKIALDARRRAWGWLLISAPAALLAMGSKESTLILPLLASALILHARQPSRAQKMGLLAGSWLLTAGFLAWRIYALGGLGFLPGHVLPSSRNLGKGHSNAAPLRAEDLLQRALAFLLPAPLGPAAPIPPIATWATAVTLFGMSRMRPSRLRALVGGIGFLLVTTLLGDMDPLGGLIWWVFPSTYWGLLMGVAVTGGMALLVRLRPRDSALVLAWGLAALLPLYHVVYNAAGNVYYLPDTYWALVWACIAAILTQPAASSLP